MKKEKKSVSFPEKSEEPQPEEEHPGIFVPPNSIDEMQKRLDEKAETNTAFYNHREEMIP